MVEYTNGLVLYFYEENKKEDASRWTERKGGEGVDW